MPISEAKVHLSSMVNDVFRRETRILVEKSGIAVTAILSTSDLERLDRLDRQWAERTAALEAFGAVPADVPAAELQREVNRIVARVWAALRTRMPRERPPKSISRGDFRDTNTLASSFVGVRKPGSTPGALVRRRRAKDFTLVLSGHTLVDLERTSTNPSLTERLSAGEIRSVLVALRTSTLVTPITVDVVAVAPQPKEDLILAVAISGQAECLGSGDT